MSESNYFINQFGKPEGMFGKLLSQIMNISNRKMYRENLKKVSDAKKILEIGFGNGKQLQMLYKYWNDKELYGIDISEDMLNIARKNLVTKLNLQ